jgi:hypothetical protein
LVLVDQSAEEVAAADGDSVAVVGMVAVVWWASRRARCAHAILGTGELVVFSARRSARDASSGANRHQTAGLGQTD